MKKVFTAIAVWLGFRPPTIAEMAAAKLREAERELLNVYAARESHECAARALEERIDRLRYTASTGEVKDKGYALSTSGSGKTINFGGLPAAGQD